VSEIEAALISEFFNLADEFCDIDSILETGDFFNPVEEILSLSDDEIREVVS